MKPGSSLPNTGTFIIPSQFTMLVTCGIIFALWMVSLYAAIIFIFGMLPAFVAALIDNTEEKFAQQIVGSFNVIGVMHPIVDILRNMNNPVHNVNVIASPNVWFNIYAASAFGWAIYWLFPKISILFLRLNAQSHVLKLKSEMQKLVEEWGDSIRNKKL